MPIRLDQVFSDAAEAPETFPNGAYTMSAPWSKQDLTPLDLAQNAGVAAQILGTAFYMQTLGKTAEAKAMWLEELSIAIVAIADAMTMIPGRVN